MKGGQVCSQGRQGQRVRRGTGVWRRASWAPEPPTSTGEPGRGLLTRPVLPHLSLGGVSGFPSRRRAGLCPFTPPAPCGAVCHSASCPATHLSPQRAWRHERPRTAPDAGSLTCLPLASEPHLLRDAPLLPRPAWAPASTKPSHPPLGASASLPRGCCVCLSVCYGESRQSRVWEHISGKRPWRAHRGDVRWGVSLSECAASAPNNRGGRSLLGRRRGGGMRPGREAQLEAPLPAPTRDGAAPCTCPGRGWGVRFTADSCRQTVLV